MVHEAPPDRVGRAGPAGAGHGEVAGEAQDGHVQPGLGAARARPASSQPQAKGQVSPRPWVKGWTKSGHGARGSRPGPCPKSGHGVH